MNKKINDSYIREFFCIPDTEEGQSEVREIKSKLTEKKYENGHDICVIDEEPDGMYFLESGTAVVLGREGEQINIMHRGQYFGEYAVLSGRKRLSTVRALGKCIVYKLSSEDLKFFLKAHPHIYGELMKRVYGQVSRKHAQILALSSMNKGIMQHPSNLTPTPRNRLILHYSILAVIYALAAYLVPGRTNAPLFILPLVFMPLYMIFSKRTLESLITSIIFASILVSRNGMTAGLADSIMDTMGDSGNVFTVLVMALIGAVVTLIEASGGITAFRKFLEKHATTTRRVFLLSYFIMLITAIDDSLNMQTSSFASYNSAREKGIVREKMALIHSMLPTVFSSFIPISLWGIYVLGTLKMTYGSAATLLLCRSIPYNLFSVITVPVMLLFAFDKLYKSRPIKEAEERFKTSHVLWPNGSERYLNTDESEVWGEISNVMLPLAVYVVSSLVTRSIFNKGFILDSAVGLVTAIIFMFLFYCAKGMMSPEEFTENLAGGISATGLPIIMYLLTMCFSSLLIRCNLEEYFEDIIDSTIQLRSLLPVVVFIVCTLLTMLLGSSWAMYAIAIPTVLHLVRPLGLDPAIFVGAITAAGIAGEKNCMYTSDAQNVGGAIGCNPTVVFKIRITYSVAISILAAIGYTIIGFVM